VKITGLILIAAIAVAGAACTGGTSAKGVAQGTTGRRTVTGKVVCLVCYARNKANSGADHDTGRMCAHACIKWEGNPAGIVAADGTVYQLAGPVVENNNARVLPHIAHTVSVTGDAFDKDGMTMIRADDLKAVP